MCGVGGGGGVEVGVQNESVVDYLFRCSGVAA